MVLNETQPARQRMEWMDLLRGGAVLLVVLWHALSVPEQFDGLETTKRIEQLNAAVSPFRIPTLLVLSGLLLERSLSKGRWRYLTGKLRHIAWPYALWLVLIFVAMGWLTRLAEPAVWLSGGILWYLAVLLFSYVVAMLRPRWLPWGLCILALLVPLWVLEPESGMLNRYLWFGAFFFLGTTVRPHLAALQQRMPGWGAALLAAVALVGGAAAVLGEVVYQTPTYFLVSVAGILFVLWCAPRIPSSPLTRVLQWYGRNSIVVYVGHALAMYVTIRVLVATGAHHSPVAYLWLAIAGFGVPTLLVLVRPRIEWLFVFPQPRTSMPAGAHIRAVRA